MEPSQSGQNNDQQNGPQRPSRRPEDQQPRPMMPQGLLLIMVAGIIFLLIYQFASTQGAGSEVDFSFFLEQLDKDNVQKITGTGLLTWNVTRLFLKLYIYGRQS